MLRRSALALSRRVAGLTPTAKTPNTTRMFTPSLARSRSSDHTKIEYRSPLNVILTGFRIPIELKTYDDLLPPGAEPGTIPTDLEQSTGLERFEILGKMQGVDVFDMRPLDASRKDDENELLWGSAAMGRKHSYNIRSLRSRALGVVEHGRTLENPIVVKSAGDEQFAGCTGYPADSHGTIWLGLSRTRPMERCPECGGVYRMDYVGPPDDAHGHGHGHEEAHGDASHNYEEPKTLADFVRPEYRGAPPGFVHPT
ncbi:MAG: hypothetical protein Q9163_002919 [Psora crenata]